MRVYWGKSMNTSHHDFTPPKRSICCKNLKIFRFYVKANTKFPVPCSLILIIFTLQFNSSQPDLFTVGIRLKRQRQDWTSMINLALQEWVNNETEFLLAKRFSFFSTQCCQKIITKLTLELTTREANIAMNEPIITRSECMCISSSVKRGKTPAMCHDWFWFTTSDWLRE